MRHDKQKAIELRKQGKSYNQIKATLNIPKSTLSDWLSKNSWSKKVKTILEEKTKVYHTARMRWLANEQRLKLEQIYLEGAKEATEEFELFKWFPLFIAGICIHWGEGDKLTKHSIRLSNVDSRLLKIFIIFLKRICGVPQKKIKAYVLLYPDLNEQVCLNFWSKNIRLPLENFTKSIIIKGRHKTKRLSYGVCTITVSSTYLKKKINIWLDLLSQELINKYKLRV